MDGFVQQGTTASVGRSNAGKFERFALSIFTLFLHNSHGIVGDHGYVYHSRRNRRRDGVWKLRILLERGRKSAGRVSSIRIGAWRIVHDRGRQIIVKRIFEIGTDFDGRESFACDDPDQAKLLPRNHQELWFFHAAANPMVDVCFGNTRSRLDVHGTLDLSGSRYGSASEGYSRSFATGSAIENIVDSSIDQRDRCIAVGHGILDANLDAESTKNIGTSILEKVVTKTKLGLSIQGAKPKEWKSGMCN